LVIAGVGNTEVGKLPDYSVVELQSMAVQAALIDSGLNAHDLDGWICQSPYRTPTYFNAESLAEYFGTDPNVTVTLSGGAVAGTMLTLAKGLIESSQATAVVCVYGEMGNTGSRGVTGLPTPMFTMANEEFELLYGGTAAPTHYGLLARRYFHEYGATTDVLAGVAISERKHAALSSEAFRRDELTMDGYLKTKMVAEPLRVPDCAVITDGAAAFVVTTLERARQLKKPPVHILGLGGKNTHWQLSQAPSIYELGVRESKTMAFAQAGISIADVDVAEIYDCFSIAAILQLEALGFCDEGQAADFVLNGQMEIGTGRCPINTDGGLLSFAHVGGLVRIVEAVRQLRGEAGPRQVPNPKIALATSIAGWVSTHYTTVLAKD